MPYIPDFLLTTLQEEDADVNDEDAHPPHVIHEYIVVSSVEAKCYPNNEIIIVDYYRIDISFAR